MFGERQQPHNTIADDFPLGERVAAVPNAETSAIGRDDIPKSPTHVLVRAEQANAIWPPCTKPVRYCDSADALAAGPVCAEPIKTSTDGLSAGGAKVKVADGEMPVYFARPANVSNPPVIIVAMEIFGLHEYIKDVTRRLGKLGAFAVAPDYYFRKGDLTKITEIAQLMPLVNTKPDAELFADLNATVDWAKSQRGNTDRLGIVGVCRGGRTVWEYGATNDKVKAGVAFYGSLIDPDAQKAVWPKSPTELVPQLKAPVLGLYGEADQGIPVSQVEAMKTALEAAGKTAKFKRAVHADRHQRAATFNRTHKRQKRAPRRRYGAMSLPHTRLFW